MNIIERMKEIISNAPNMAQFTNGVHVDFTDSEPENFGLSSTGDIRIKEDVLGNQTRQHTFVLYAVNQTLNDYDRLANSTFLLELSNYLESLKWELVTTEINSEQLKGVILKIECANGMLFQMQSENITDGCMYQLQISALYTVEREEY